MRKSKKKKADSNIMISDLAFLDYSAECPDCHENYIIGEGYPPYCTLFLRTQCNRAICPKLKEKEI